MQGLIGKKAGMTRICNPETGEITPVTVVTVAGNVVLQQKTVEKDGYSAVQVGFDQVADRKLSKAEVGHSKKYAGVVCRHIREFQLEAGESLEAGTKLSAEMFSGVRYIDVTGNTMGRGFAGCVKHYGFHIGRATHGNTHRRARGSLGASTDTARVFPGLKMAGQYGNVKKTIKGLQVVSVDVENSLVFVKGAIPGKNNGVVFLKKNLVKG